jgi:hypothetical protein
VDRTAEPFDPEYSRNTPTTVPGLDKHGRPKRRRRPRPDPRFRAYLTPRTADGGVVWLPLDELGALS